MKRACSLVAAVLCAALSAATTAEADYGRQYYGNWSYHPQYNYHYCHYYYKPTPTYPTYSYHYCVCKPAQPRYVYFYNPHRKVYWGRFDLEGKDGAQYSLLKDADRKPSLADIPESAFPPASAMPAIPDVEDGTTIVPLTEAPPPQP